MNPDARFSRSRGYWIFQGGCSTWRFNLDVLIAPTSKQIQAWAKLKYGWQDHPNDNWDFTGTAGSCIECPDNPNTEGFIIYLKEWPTKPQFICALSHECLHAAYRILIKRGVQMFKSDEEALCYLHEWLLRQVLDAVKNTKRK